jgi:hypothetical protein
MGFTVNKSLNPEKNPKINKRPSYPFHVNTAEFLIGSKYPHIVVADVQKKKPHPSDEIKS